MKPILAALFCGVLFGVGLAISGMTNPAKVIGFVNFTGAWDPSLALVMVGALITFGIGFRLTQTSMKPLFADAFQVPKRTDIDARLVGGAVIFGVGWGLSGICPGPGITALAYGKVSFYVFFTAMVVGSLAYGLTTRNTPRTPATT